MAINFKLTAKKAEDPTLDDMSRTWVGHDPESSAHQLYEQNRGLWLLGARAHREEYATFSLDGHVIIVIAIEDIETIPVKDPRRRPKSAIIGRVLQPGDDGYDLLIDQPVDSHRNPVTYLDDGTNTCRCGCGQPVPQHRQFLPGHDQRAIHERIARQWGDTLGFIRWFDQTYPAA